MPSAEIVPDAGLLKREISSGCRSFYLTSPGLLESEDDGAKQSRRQRRVVLCPVFPGRERMPPRRRAPALFHPFRNSLYAVFDHRLFPPVRRPVAVVGTEPVISDEPVRPEVRDLHLDVDRVLHPGADARHDDEIAREAKRLLKQTSLSDSRIAMRCGFKNVGNLRNLFRKTCGMSMRVYRHRGARCAPKPGG